MNLTPADLPPLPPPPRPDPATSPHPNVPHTLAESTDKPFNPLYTHDVLQRIWQTRRNGRLWGRSRLRKLRVVQRPSATIRGPSIFIFFPLRMCLLTRVHLSTPQPPRPHLIRARPTNPSRASSRRMRCVILPCKLRRTCCSGATNNMDRCAIAIFVDNCQFLMVKVAGRAGVVRRIRRDDR